MGNTSSQLAASQSQSQPQRPADSRASLPQMNGAASSQPEDLRAKKRRNSSGDAPRVAKKLKKDRGSRDSLDNANENNIRADSGAAHTEDTIGGRGLTRKRSKKKSKKEEAQRDTADDEVGNGQAIQESFLSEIIPPSTMDSSHPGKQLKSKRKRHKGRPSGFNLAPMADSSQLQEEGDEAVPTSSVAVVAGLPSLSQAASPSQQEQRKDRKRKARRSGHLSPDLTNTQQSVPDLEEHTVPGTQETQINGTSQEEQQRQDLDGYPAKKGKSKKRQRKAALDEDYSAVLPTPPDAVEDGTNTPGAASPDIPSHKWAAINAPSQPESSQRSPKVTKEKRNGISQHQDDIEDDQPNRVVQETPHVASGKKGKSKKNAAAEEVEEAPSQDMPIPPASTKRKRKSQATGELDKPSSSKQQGRAGERESESAESVTKTPKKSKRARRSTTDGEIEQQMTRADANDEESSRPNVNGTEHKNGDKKSKKQGSLSKKQDSDPSGGSDKKANSSTQVVAKGAFTDAEKEKVDKIFGEMLRDSGMPDSEFRKSLQSWKDAADFKEAVHTALPQRPAAAIRKFCQRRYHNLERGMWLPEDDEKLKHAHAVHPGKWTEISALVGRTPADCKDRWRNSVSIGATMQTGPWSKEEEDALTKAVNESINELRKANKADKNKPTDRDSLEQMLSWNVVASKLGGSRSAKRCNEKWQKLNKRKKLTPADQHLATGLKDEESSKKLRAIEKYYNECDVGDLFDILTEIHTAIPDHSRHYDHESTLWSTIAMQNQGSRFKSAMRRRGLYDAADVYKEQIQQGQTIPAKAKALADHLEREWGVEALREKRAFSAKPKNRSKVKSSELVNSDDDEAEDDKAQVEDGAEEGGEEVDESVSESSSPAHGDVEEKEGESS